jgi:hypothetical protein
MKKIKQKKTKKIVIVTELRRSVKQIEKKDTKKNTDITLKEFHIISLLGNTIPKTKNLWW